jgi:hypothetical protein
MYAHIGVVDSDTLVARVCRVDDLHWLAGVQSGLGS